MDKREKSPTYRDLTKGRRMVGWRGLWAAAMGSVPAQPGVLGVRGREGKAPERFQFPKGSRQTLQTLAGN